MSVTNKLFYHLNSEERTANYNTDRNQIDVNESKPNLRQFIIPYISKTVHDENIRMSDLTNLCFLKLYSL